MTPEQAAAYLAAFIDGEGHICCTINGRKSVSKNIAFTNTNKQLFDRVIEISKILGLAWRVYYRKKQRPGWSNTWIAYLAGGKESFENFRRLIPLQCQLKRDKLDDLIASYVDRETVFAKMRTSVLVNCQQCDKAFYAFPADIKRNHGKFCSHKCGCEGRKRSFERKCEQCGKIYFVNKARVKRTRFCSVSCAGKSKTEMLRAQAKRASDIRWGRESGVEDSV